MKALVLKSFDYGTQDEQTHTCESGTVLEVLRVQADGVLVSVGGLPIGLDFEEFELIEESE